MAAMIVLITGTSSGLGRAMAEHLASKGHEVIGGALEDGLDVRDDASVERFVARAPRIDALVNNAGFGLAGAIEETSIDEAKEQFETNFFGVARMVRAVLPVMRAQGRGRIVNISSGAALASGPFHGYYSASKWALEGASESLWYEVLPWNIRVTLVEPGFIRSDSFQHTRATQGSARAESRPGDPYHVHYSAMTRLIERLMTRSTSSPERVADVILKVMRRRRPPLRVAGTRDAHFFYLLRRFLPRTLYHAILYRGLPGIGSWGQSGESDDRGSE